MGATREGKRTKLSKIKKTDPAAHTDRQTDNNETTNDEDLQRNAFRRRCHHRDVHQRNRQLPPLCVYEPCAPVESGEYVVPDLPYPYDSLEPSIDNETMTLHHDRHFAGYTKKMNKALGEMAFRSSGDADNATTVEAMMSGLSSENLGGEDSAFFVNNGGGYLNHKMFFATMGPDGQSEPTGPLLEAIEADFGDFGSMQEEMNTAAMSVFGSGWGFLVLDPSNNTLSVISRPNQNSPYLDMLIPLLGLDVWEHAYYLKYGPGRSDYVDNWWNVVDFKPVEEAYAKATGSA